MRTEVHLWDRQVGILADDSLVLDREIEYSDGTTVPYARVERATMMLEDGKPHALFCAVADGPREGGYLGWRASWNVGSPPAGRGCSPPFG